MWHRVPPAESVRALRHDEIQPGYGGAADGAGGDDFAEYLGRKAIARLRGQVAPAGAGRPAGSASCSNSFGTLKFFVCAGCRCCVLSLLFARRFAAFLQNSLDADPAGLPFGWPDGQAAGLPSSTFFVGFNGAFGCDGGGWWLLVMFECRFKCTAVGCSVH